MKNKTITAILIAGVLGIFAFFYFAGPAKAHPFSIVGNWTIDSVYSVRSDTATDAISAGIMATFQKKKWQISFRADSTITDNDSNPGDTISKRYFVSDTTLHILESSEDIVLHFRTKTDSLLELNGKDSTVYVLRKKN